MKIALVTAIASYGRDDDLAHLVPACTEAGITAEVRAWDDPTVSWARYDAAVLRSTWDYIDRLPEFLAWCETVATKTRLWNPPAVVRWNTDKRYLGELAAQGLPVIGRFYLAPGEDPATMPDHDEFVVKPTVGAGSRDARRFVRAERDAATAHAAALLAEERHVLVQPYLDGVDRLGETALVYFDGEFSHAIRKEPLLQRGGAPGAPAGGERIQARTPSAEELAVGERVLAAIPGGPLAYARVDLLPSEDGPQLLELELTEPSVFLPWAPGAAARFALSLRRRLESV
ncbi:hypothetical protein P873_07585 [Arenimonas composti TR7-09 = DSM 18010]|uniref:ATP-grasp domain-containing protein n=1 Tax=Arenimonas composti TR7-09 = DSM 18010 TaxID=1121013 RepID=A0A091C0P7_9GAMM|nr:hypothetical protein P873_07585 [Arenimonas composti TR7-09 = DSM 18010]